VPQGVRGQRLDQKRRQGMRKRLRKPPHPED
jgi:hypothetical protein